MNNKDKNETAEFLKPSKKWGALFAEVWGTFLLVLVGAGSVVVSKMTGEVSKGMEVVAPGLLVMAVIYFMGAVSGAHKSGSYCCLCLQTTFSLEKSATISDIQ